MEAGSAVAVEAYTSKDEYAISIVPSIGYHDVSPPGARQYSIHGQGDPLLAIHVEDANVVQSHILGAGEYAIISSTVDHQQNFLIGIFQSA